MSDQEAIDLGWRPLEEYKGDPAKWVDAATYLERGNTVLPLVQKAKKELEGKLSQANLETQVLRKAVADSQAAIKALQESHDADTKKKVQEARRALLANLEQAKIDGDTKLEVKLTDELIDLNAASRAAPEPKAPPAATAPSGGYEATMDPAFVAFAEANPWFGKDQRKTQKAMGIANLLRADEANDELTGKQFMTKVLSEMEGGEGVSKVAGGRPSGDSGDRKSVV